MIKRKFGWTNVDIPIVGQGTWLIDNDNDNQAIKTLQIGLDLGMTHIDTAAEMYGDGKQKSWLVMPLYKETIRNIGYSNRS